MLHQLFTDRTFLQAIFQMSFIFQLWLILVAVGIGYIAYKFLNPKKE